MRFNVSKTERLAISGGLRELCPLSNEKKVRNEGRMSIHAEASPLEHFFINYDMDVEGELKLRGEIAAYLIFKEDEYEKAAKACRDRGHIVLPTQSFVPLTSAILAIMTERDVAASDRADWMSEIRDVVLHEAEKFGFDANTSLFIEVAVFATIYAFGPAGTEMPSRASRIWSAPTMIPVPPRRA